MQSQEFPSVADGTGLDSSFNRPAPRFRRVVALSVLVGLLSGLGEGIIDFTVLHFQPPAILYVTIVANVMVFLFLGVMFWVLSLGLEPQVASFLLRFILLWAMLHGWEREFTQDAGRGPLWLLSVIGTCLMAALLSLWAWKHERRVARTLDRTLPWTLGIALACLAGILLYRPNVEHRAMSNTPVATESLPNVILIIVDTLRADHLSCYHYERLTSPNFDQLATRGVLFENAIAPSSWTLPSHASMLSGLYPNQHRAQRFRDQLRADVPTIAEELERAGYRTGAFSGSPFFTPRQGLDRGFLEFGDFSFSPTQALIGARYTASLIGLMKMTGWFEQKVEQPTGTNINESVLHWVDNTHQPFFLVLNYYEVHEPNSIPRPWRRHFSAGQGSENYISDVNMRTVSQVTPRMQSKIDEYDSAIAYDDDCLQKLMAELGRRHFMDNTLLIVTGDHGEGLGEHGLLTHGTALYYPLIHVPLIFYWPGHLPAGLRIKQGVSTKDISATILDLLGASRSQLPGKSLALLWNGQAPPDQWPMPISELVRPRRQLGNPSGGHREIESIVSSEFQLILDDHEGPSLYNWQADPQERDNLFFSPRYEAVGTKLAAELRMEQQGLP